MNSSVHSTFSSPMLTRYQTQVLGGTLGYSYKYVNRILAIKEFTLQWNKKKINSHTWSYTVAGDKTNKDTNGMINKKLRVERPFI